MANPYLVGQTQSAVSSLTYDIPVDTPTSFGDQIAVEVGTPNLAITVAGVTDTQGNSYSQITSNATQQNLALWVSSVNPNPLTETDTVTVTLSAANTSQKNFQVIGVPGSTGVDVVATPVNGSANNTSIASGVLGQANEVVLSLLANGSGGGTPTFNNSFTSIGSIQNGGSGPYLSAAFLIVSSTSSVTSTTTLSGTATYAAELVTFKIPAPPPTPVILNQWPITAQNAYGLQGSNVTNTKGNALVAILGLGSGSQSTLPRFNVADNARNYWQFAGTRFDKTATRNRRVDVFVAPNADPATFVSVAESWYTDGVAGVILEVSGFPAYAQVDFIASNGGSPTSSIAVSGTATASDVVIGGLLISGTGSTPSVTPTGVVDLATVSTGSSSTDMTSQNLYPATVLASAGAFSASWAFSGTLKCEAIMVGFLTAPAAPSQPNPNWPSMQIRAAFGYQPGDVSAYPSWTDLTTRAIDENGQSVVKTSRGREYELAQAEAGETSITFGNFDGAFNPNNAASPFYPNVLPATLVQTLATWNGKTYPVCTVYANKWPQNFSDPQYGESRFEGTDAIGQASQAKLLSAYAGDVLVDSPWAYFRLGEDYTPANGLPFSNSARTNLKSAYGVDDNVRPGGVSLATGQTINLAGDSSTGIGITGGAQRFAGGPGALYRDNDMPGLDAGFSVEFWFIFPHVNIGLPTGQNTVTLLSLNGPPDNYPGNPFGDGTRLIIQAQNDNSGNSISAEVTDFSSANSVQAVILGALDNGLHHGVATVINNSGTWTVTIYLDGGAEVASNTFVTGSLPSGLSADKLAIGPVILGGGFRDVANFTIGQVALYPYRLSTTRIAQHYLTGSKAASGELVRSRYARLNAWAGAGLPIAATASSPSPLIGNADQIEGSALSDCSYNLTVDEGGMYYCDGWGTSWYASRTSLYNRVPKYTFGDNCNPGYMSDAPNIHSCFGVDAATTKAFFDTPISFISGTNPTTDPRTDGLRGTPVMNYTKYAQFVADVTNAPFTQNSVVYNPAGPINRSVYQWLRYDLEGGTTWPSPPEEKADPQTFIANFVSLAHANGFKVMLVPARDLGNTDTAHPKLAGEHLDQWFLRTNIPAACAAGDMFSVQAQADQGEADEFYYLFSQSRKLIRAVNPSIPVWCGVSTARGNGSNMYDSARLAALADGFWINIIGDTANSIDFMKRVLAGPLETPFLTGDFDFSDTFLYNTTASQRTISASQQVVAINNVGQVARQMFNQYGQDAIEADFGSQFQYMPRGPLQQDIETTSDQDAADRASWSLAKYRQPQLRANEILLDPGANPAIFTVALGIEQGDVVQVVRRPVGSPEILVLCIVQKVGHDIGPSKWQTTVALAPYYPDGNVIQLDNTPYNTPASGVLGW